MKISENQENLGHPISLIQISFAFCFFLYQVKTGQFFFLSGRQMTFKMHQFSNFFSFSFILFNGKQTF